MKILAIGVFLITFFIFCLTTLIRVPAMAYRKTKDYIKHEKVIFKDE